MKNTSQQKIEGFWTATKGVFEQGFRNLENAIIKRGGKPREVLNHLNADPDFTDDVAKFILGQTVLTLYDHVRQIMGENFLEPVESIYHFKIKQTKKAMKAIRAFENLPSEDMLIDSKDDYILVADFGLSILDIRNRVDRELFSSHEDALYNWNYFAKLRETPQWRLISRKPVANSFHKNWDKQKALLNENEDVPKVRQVAYAIILNYLTTGERLFKDCYIRCQDEWLPDRHVDLKFDPSGLIIRKESPDFLLCGPIGITSSQKFEKS